MGASMGDSFDPLFGSPPCQYEEADCLPDCEHGFAGPCLRRAVRLAEVDLWRQKAEAWDLLEPELAALNAVRERIGCPADERLIPWAIRMLERLSREARD
jgi:hypothetical protein